MFEAEPFELGDQIRVGFHVGVYVGPWRVMHARKGDVARMDTYAEFAGGHTPVLVARVPQEFQTDAVTRAIAMEGKAYDFFTANCEHFANYAQTGMSYSPTLQLIGAVGIIGGLMWLGGQRG